MLVGALFSSSPSGTRKLSHPWQILASRKLSHVLIFVCQRNSILLGALIARATVTTPE
jgi:hypothetical protein